jgi:hypothetical protein
MIEENELELPFSESPGQEKMDLGLEDDKQVVQPLLFDHPPDWTTHWVGMPKFELEDLTPWQSIQVHFACKADRVRFSKLIGQPITDKTKSVWHPRADAVEMSKYCYRRPGLPPAHPRYPIYVISKGRWESRYTVKALDRLGLKYHVVVEPQEYDHYAAVIDPDKLKVLPFSNLGQGSIPARNWVWEDSIARGAERHWILDDNIRDFYRWDNNLITKVTDGITFAKIEDFADRFTNVAMAGMNYFMFTVRKEGRRPPFTLNTRVYSCILLRNDLSHRWRGRYNEDTDLSLRFLKDGLCTVLVNAFPCDKLTTMTMKGGNTEDLYEIDNGRLLMAESLRDQHPDVCKVTRKWDRWQHHVDYSSFTQPLIYKDGLSADDFPPNDECGMVYERTDPDSD